MGYPQYHEERKKERKMERNIEMKLKLFFTAKFYMDSSVFFFLINFLQILMLVLTENEYMNLHIKQSASVGTTSE